MCSIVRTEDRWIGDSSGTKRGQPTTSAGAVISPTLGISATFTSQWYTRNPTDQRVQAHFFGDQELAANGLEVQETWDDPKSSTPTVHRTSSASSAAGSGDLASRHVATIDARVVAPHYRIKVTNGASAQTLARLWAQISSQ